MKKKRLIALAISATFLLTGCTSALNDQSVKITEKNPETPIIVSTYDFQGQKVDQIKLAKIKITSDDKINSAIDVKYGQNKIVHNNNPMLIYNDLTNFADQYDKNITNKHYLDEYGNPVSIANKSIPLSGSIYGMFKKQLPSDGTAVIIKSKSGAPIGIFAGHVVSVKDFGDSENSNAVITLDGHKIFIYNSAYTLYPISAMESMYHNKKATNISHQAGIKTKSVTPQVDSGNKKTKK